MTYIKLGWSKKKKKKDTELELLMFWKPIHTFYFVSLFKSILITSLDITQRKSGIHLGLKSKIFLQKCEKKKQATQQEKTPCIESLWLHLNWLWGINQMRCQSRKRSWLLYRFSVDENVPFICTKYFFISHLLPPSLQSAIADLSMGHACTRGCVLPCCVLLLETL